MFWLSEDCGVERALSYDYFKRQPHRIGVLFGKLDVEPGDVVLVILSRVPE